MNEYTIQLTEDELRVLKDAVNEWLDVLDNQDEENEDYDTLEILNEKLMAVGA